MDYIAVKDLVKTFTVRKKREKGQFLREKTEVKALDRVSFSVEKGELVGYIGPNGAGKSTTVKILSGILTPDSGHVLVDGRIPWKERKEHARQIGVVFGQRSQLWWDVPILDSYILLREIYSLSEHEWKTRLDELTERLELGSLLRTPLRLLSLGQRMRAELCGSLLHRPGLLFLDEPTIGLDAVSKLALRDFLREENRANATTILLTTHDMEDVAALCSRVMVLGHGHLLFDGPLSRLLSKYDHVRIAEVVYEHETEVTQLPEGCSVFREGEKVRVVYEPSKVPTQLLLNRLQASGAIREMTVQPQNVDTMIAEMYRELDL